MGYPHLEATEMRPMLDFELDSWDYIPFAVLIVLGAAFRVTLVLILRLLGLIAIACKHLDGEELLGWQALRASWALSLTITSLALALGAPARSQEPPPPVESIAESARNVREHKSNSTKHPKIITNDDLVVQYSEPSASAFPPESLSMKGAAVREPAAADCDNPDAERLKMDLLVAQRELDQIRRELFYMPVVISDGDVDLSNFKPGYSGLFVGAPPMLETHPPGPARVTEVQVEEKIASLKRALIIACDSPEDARIQKKLDLAEQELNLLQREFVLDQAVYYGRTNYAEDTGGKARLDAEQQQIQYLQSEIARLKGELAAR
jgi:hypothetical protein